MKRTRARGRLSRGVTVNLQGRLGRFRGSPFGGVQITVDLGEVLPGCARRCPRWRDRGRERAGRARSYKLLL